MNTIVDSVGQTDGIMTLVQDDETLIYIDDVLFRTNEHPTQKFNYLMILPWIGDGSDIEQEFWIDDLVLSTGQPGVCEPTGVLAYQKPN
jgi:hypothetical protein